MGWEWKWIGRIVNVGGRVVRKDGLWAQYMARIVCIMEVYGEERWAGSGSTWLEPLMEVYGEKGGISVLGV